MKIYTAAPISGYGAEEVFGYFDGITKTLREMGYTPLCPMTGKDYMRCEREFRAQGYGQPLSTNHAIFERDRWMVTQCDIVLMNLTMAKEVSIGCMMELAWASLLGKNTIVVMADGNPHQHSFVLEAADIVLPTLKDALDYLEKFAMSMGSISCCPTP